VTRSFAVGGRAVHLHAAGDALVPHLTRALAHLPPAAPGEAGLAVRAWDDESATDLLRGARDGADSYRALVDGAFVVAEDGRVDAIDVAAGEAFLWVDSPRRIQWFEGAAPLQTCLHPWAAAHGLRFVHAGAVGGSDGCVLIVGRSGAGKSTTALSCVGSPLRYLADDFCLARSADATIFSLYSSAKLTDDALTRLPRVAAHAERPGPPEEKSVAYLHEFAPEALVLQAPLRAIVVPRITDRTAPALVPTSRATALAELAPSSLVSLRRERADAFRGIAAVAASVPCHVLELGSDLAAIPELLGGLLDD
jgi:hypothetical protein